MKRSVTFQAVLAAPMTVLVGFFFAVPLFMALLMAFRPFDETTIVGSGWTLSNFVKALTDSYFYADLGRTLLISALTAFFSLLFGYPLAWHLNNVRSKLLRLALVLIVLLPLMTSFVVTSFAWILLLGNNGLINRALLSLGIIGDAIPILNTISGVVIVNTYSYIAFAILPIFASLQNINPSFARAARIHGATPATAFWRVTLPLSMPGVVSGGLIVFALSMSGFVVPFIIGGGQVMIVPLMIFRYTLQIFNWPGAAALGVLLFAVTLGLTWLIAALTQRIMKWEN
ncbi:ABC transporter permease [Mesorhizobium sp. SP-1A]|uniref:ABC transporter permease n=1 Tax=Mesorhizobium sp. SP-1A TaxID=3077840 RepID=UPI0028F6E614|nr:ABC transporter permease [Mesorhizobium sp. SP-1A]